MTMDYPALTSTFEVVIGPGFDVGAHVHAVGEEIFYVVEGELDVLAFEPIDRVVGDWHRWKSATCVGRLITQRSQVQILPSLLRGLHVSVRPIFTFGFDVSAWRACPACSVVELGPGLVSWLIRLTRGGRLCPPCHGSRGAGR